VVRPVLMCATDDDNSAASESRCDRVEHPSQDAVLEIAAIQDVGGANDVKLIAESLRGQQVIFDQTDTVDRQPRTDQADSFAWQQLTSHAPTCNLQRPKPAGEIEDVVSYSREGRLPIAKQQLEGANAHEVGIYTDIAGYHLAADLVATEPLEPLQGADA
jgi:hypothetical protein